MLGPDYKSTERFSARAEDYAKNRPGYPAELYDFFRNQLGLQTSHVVADVGSGAGHFSEPLLRNGNTVFAVEPNQEMRGFAEKRLGHYANFRSMDGRGEATTLPDNSMDFVTVAQAFHWFDPAEAGKEFLRILKPGGSVALIWQLRRDSDTDLARGYETLLQKHGRNYPAIKKSWYVEPETLQTFFGHENYSSKTFYYADELGFEGLRGRMDSASFAPRPGDDDYEEAIATLQSIFDRCQQNGIVKVEYDCQMYYGSFDQKA